MQTSTVFAALAALLLLAPAGWAQGAGADHGHAAGDAPSPDPAAIWRLGDLTLETPYARATLPNAPVAGGFLSITNNGAANDRLIAAASAVAARAEIHEMTMNGDVMTMRALADGLPIPAGETVALQPGGYHIMFLQLTGPLVKGETVDVTLTFAEAGEITVPLSVLAFNARAADDAPQGADVHAGH
ncbi:MAG: copper chaperone PCu(A)C [Cereibacter sp.]|jgi:hypothetical protein|nr:copper chaperone PCu(A)C [Cereibacter sp.]